MEYTKQDYNSRRHIAAQGKRAASAATISQTVLHKEF